MKICKNTRRQPILRPTCELYSITGQNLNVYGETEICEEKIGVIPVIVVDNIKHAFILGVDVINNGGVLDCKNGVFTINGHTFPLKQGQEYHSIHSLGQVPPKINGKLIFDTVYKNSDVFTAKGEKIGLIPNLTSMKIVTTGPPIKQRPYRVPLKKRAAMERVINQMLQQGIIEPSSSPWSSPCLLVDRKDTTDDPRLVINYTKLNKVTKKRCISLTINPRYL